MEKPYFESIAVWPEGVITWNTSNETRDKHYTRHQAQCVCDLLEKHGFGGDGKIFPLETRVEAVY
jgi:hypothetical protein